MHAHGIHCLSVDQKLYFLTHLHLPSNEFDEDNSIDWVDFLRKESSAEKHDAVKALKGQFWVIREHFIRLYFSWYIEYPEIERVQNKIQ